MCNKSNANANDMLIDNSKQRSGLSYLHFIALKMARLFYFLTATENPTRDDFYEPHAIVCCGAMRDGVVFMLLLCWSRHVACGHIDATVVFCLAFARHLGVCAPLTPKLDVFASLMPSAGPARNLAILPDIWQICQISGKLARYLANIWQASPGYSRLLTLGSGPKIDFEMSFEVIHV
jgi:hypothetical protein